MAVYLAAAHPLRLVPWDETKPAFYVATLTESDRAATVQFKHPHVVYVGSYEGCGCGFQFGEHDPDSHEPEELEQGRRSLESFSQYLRDELPRVGPMQLFACWEGDQTASPVVRRTITPALLLTSDFSFHQKELSDVVEDAG